MGIPDTYSPGTHIKWFVGVEFGSSFRRSFPPNLRALHEVSASANYLASPPTMGLHQPTWGFTNPIWRSPGSARLLVTSLCWTINLMEWKAPGVTRRIHRLTSSTAQEPQVRWGWMQPWHNPSNKKRESQQSIGKGSYCTHSHRGCNLHSDSQKNKTECLLFIKITITQSSSIFLEGLSPRLFSSILTQLSLPS